MASTQNIGEAGDNPVAINVTAMVDVIFCLCIFFMCSLKFKQLDAKIDTWLPGPGQPHPLTTPLLLDDLRIFMRWDPHSGTTLRQIGHRPPVRDDRELLDSIRQHRTLQPIVIDSLSDVPWRDVVHVTDLCRGAGIDRIEFAAPSR